MNDEAIKLRITIDGKPVSGKTYLKNKLRDYLISEGYTIEEIKDDGIAIIMNIEWKMSIKKTEIIE